MSKQGSPERQRIPKAGFQSKLSRFSPTGKRLLTSSSQKRKRVFKRPRTTNSVKRIIIQKNNDVSARKDIKKTKFAPSENLKRIALSKSRIPSRKTQRGTSSDYFNRVAHQHKTSLQKRPMTQNSGRRSIHRNMSAAKVFKKTNISTEESRQIKTAWGTMSNNFSTAKIDMSQLGCYTERNQNNTLIRKRLSDVSRNQNTQLASSTIGENLTLMPTFDHILS